MGKQPVKYIQASGNKSFREIVVAFTSHEEYFESLSPELRTLMLSIRQEVESLLPQASRCIGYQMPAFRGNKYIFFYFAAFKKHIGIYPPVTADAELMQALQPYRGQKGNLSFRSDQLLPLELIGRVAMALHSEYESGARKR